MVLQSHREQLIHQIQMATSGFQACATLGSPNPTNSHDADVAICRRPQTVEMCNHPLSNHTAKIERILSHARIAKPHKSYLEFILQVRGSSSRIEALGQECKRPELATRPLHHPSSSSIGQSWWQSRRDPDKFKNMLAEHFRVDEDGAQPGGATDLAPQLYTTPSLKPKCPKCS